MTSPSPRIARTSACFCARVPRRARRLLVLATCPAILLLASPGPVALAEVSVTPRLIVNEIYSDNINLTSDDQQEEFITQVIPGISVNARGRRISGNLDYARENLYYLNNSDRNTDFNQLQANGSAELHKDVLFLNASGSIRQQVIQPGSLLIIDNLNPAIRTNITTYAVGPLLRNRHGNVAESTLSYQAGKVKYSGTTQLADADITMIDLSVDSGPRFRTADWSVRYSLNETDRGTGDETSYEHLYGDARLRMGPRLDFLMRAGYINDDIQGVQGLETGSYVSAGLVWRPTPFWTLEGTYGTRYHDASVTWTPSPRTLLNLGYTNRTLGIDTGERWIALFRRNMKRVTFEMSYSEDTTNQQLLDIAGSRPPPLLTVGGTQVNPETIVFRQTNEDFLRKILRSGIGIDGIRNSLAINLTAERREFRLSDDVDRFAGADVVWEWRLSSRSNTEVTGGVLNRRFDGDITEDTYWYGGLGLVRMLRPNIQTSIRYRYIEAQSDDDVTVYRENRVVAGLFVVF